MSYWGRFSEDCMDKGDDPRVLVELGHPTTEKQVGAFLANSPAQSDSISFAIMDILKGPLDVNTTFVCLSRRELFKARIIKIRER